MVRLSWTKSAKMALKGLRMEYRRSLLTGLSIILTLAFLSFVWTETDLLAALRRAAPQHTRLRQQLVLAGQLQPSQSQSQRKTVLVIMSLIVCTVGISNAMAMAVTERFGQIGTMKCLGASSGLIARLYLLEAMFLALVGTLIGAAAGMMLALGRSLFQYGSAALGHVPWPALALTAFYTALIGVGIALLGALYPAVIAARMQPVQAMRVTG